MTFSSVEGEFDQINNLQSFTEDLGVYYDGVKMCSTVLAKYIFDKWKLALPIFKYKRALREKASTQFERSLKEKVFEGWSNRMNIKKKERQLIIFGREFFDECVLKRAFGILLEYKEKRKNINQLKSIGNELHTIRVT